MQDGQGHLPSKTVQTVSLYFWFNLDQLRLLQEIATIGTSITKEPKNITSIIRKSYL